MDENLIKEGEGYRQKVYKDSTGNKTIGWGHKLVGDQIDNLQKVTEQQAQQMLTVNLNEAREKSEGVFGKQALQQMGPQRSAVLTDMSYNMGKLSGWPKLRQSVKEGDYQKASQDILNSKYAGQVGNRAIRNAYIMKTGKIVTKEQAAKQHSK